MSSHIPFALAAFHHSYPVGPHVTVLAQQLHALLPNHVVDAAPLHDLGSRPDLQELCVPREVPDRQTVSRTHDFRYGFHGRTEAIRDVSLGAQLLAAYLDVLCNSPHANHTLEKHTRYLSRLFT